MIILFFSTSSSDSTDGPSSSKKLKLNDENVLRIEKEKKAQNKLLFKYIDYLKSLKSSTCKEILEYNKQEVPESNIAAVCY